MATLKRQSKKIVENIKNEGELRLKLSAVAPADIRDFMENYKRGTFYTLGIYSSISIAKNFKKNDKKSFVYNTTILFTNLNLQKRIEISDYLFDQLKGE